MQRTVRRGSIVQGHVTPDANTLSRNRKSVLSPPPIILKKLGTNFKKMIYDTGKSAVEQTKIVATPIADTKRFVLTDTEIVTMATWGAIVEKHYSKRAGKWTPMDMEWAKDGLSGELFLVQARPETVQAERDYSKLNEYKVSGQGKIVRGIFSRLKTASGTAHLILSPKQIKDFKKGEVLVTTMTDPDWEPIMKMASAIVTDKGGRTSHAAIVSRELGLPAIVGTGNATKVLKTGMMITADASGSDHHARLRTLRSLPVPTISWKSEFARDDAARGLCVRLLVMIALAIFMISSGRSWWLRGFHLS